VEVGTGFPRRGPLGSWAGAMLRNYLCNALNVGITNISPGCWAGLCGETTFATRSRDRVLNSNAGVASLDAANLPLQRHG
jgi:hypothetical protein